MEGEGNGNKDEYFFLGLGTVADKSKDDGGRIFGSYLLTTKGTNGVTVYH